MFCVVCPPADHRKFAPPGPVGTMFTFSIPQKSQEADVGLVCIHLNWVLADHAAAGIGIEY